jgi:hypothetical protein
MRANSPTEGFELLNLVTDEPEKKMPTKEELELAKIGKSADWQIILKHLNSRIDAYKADLLNRNFTSTDPMAALATVMSAQAVINEFNALIKEVEFTTKIVDEARQG